MKKYLFVLLGLLVFSATTVYAQELTEKEKERQEKEAKKQAKENAKKEHALAISLGEPKRPNAILAIRISIFSLLFS